MLFKAQFLTGEETAALCAEMRSAERFPATLFREGEYQVRRDDRSASRVRVSAGFVDLVVDRMREWTPRLASYFQVPLGALQEPQFVAYSEGDYFTRHCDRSSEADAPAPLRNRCLSAVVLLNPEEYEGGVLTFHDIGLTGTRIGIKGVAGEVVAFGSGVMHEVTVVTRGERFSIVVLYEATALLA